MNEERLKQLYSSASEVFDMPNYEQFILDMQDDSKLSQFRESMSEYYDIPELDQFKTDLGFSKKKEDTESPSEDGSLDSQDSEFVKKFKSTGLATIANDLRIPAFLQEQILTLTSAFDPELKEVMDQSSFEEREMAFGSLAEVSGQAAAGTELREVSSDLKEKSNQIAETFKEYDQTISEDILEGVKELDPSKLGQATSRIFAEVGGAIPSIMQAFLGPVGLAAIGLGAAAEKSKELQEEGQKLGVKTSATAALYGLAEAALETVTRGIGKKFFKSLAGKGSEFIETSIKQFVKETSKDFAKEGSSELGTELLQNLTDYAIQGDEEAFNKALGHYADIFIIGGFATAPISGATQGAQVTRQTLAKRAINRQLENSKYDDLVSMFRDPEVNQDTENLAEDNVKKFLDFDLKQKVEEGEISQDEADGILKNFEDAVYIKGEFNGIDIPADKRPEIARLLLEKRDLKAKISGKDPALVGSDILRFKQIDGDIQNVLNETVEEAPVEETPAEQETVVEETPVTEEVTVETVGDIVNRPVTLTSLGGSPLDTPITGDLYLDGQQVVVEDADGNITEVGNFDDIADTKATDLGIEYETSQVSVNNDGSLTIDNKNYTIQEDLPTGGLVFDEDGNVTEASVKDETGKPVMFKGTLAEDIAYQVLLSKAESPEQKQRITEELDKDEEFQNILREAQEPTQEAADTDTQQTARGNRLINEPLQDATTISDRFTKRKGIDQPATEVSRELDEEKSTRIAEEFDKLESNPNDPQVKESYEALAEETVEQYQELIDAGYSIEIDNGEPYKNSAEMIEDLRKNKRIKIFSTEAGFGSEQITDQQRQDNPMLRDSGFKDANGQTLLINDVFRAVHDFFGHAKEGNSFGPKGEEIAWRVHSKMFSPKARRAMTTETRGQNSWVNFSGVNDKAFAKRDEARALRKQAEEETDVNKKIELLKKAEKKVDEAYKMMKFADQKIGLLPDEFVFEEETTREETKEDSELQKMASLFKAGNLVEQVANAVKALSKIAPDVTYKIYETQEEYEKATGRRSAGSYDPDTRVISINASKANQRTVAHETFHAIITNMVKSDAEARALTKRMIKAVSRNAPFELKQYLNDFAAGYDNNIQSEEKLAELVGYLATEYDNLSNSTQSTIKRWLDAIAKRLGLKPFTDAEVIDVLNTIAGKIGEGEQIAFEDIDVLGDPNTVGGKMSKRFQADFSDRESGMTFSYDVNGQRFEQLENDGFIRRDNKLANFNGDFMLLHQPDAAFSGTILKDGEILVEGKGGIFFPIKFHDDGMFWASTANAATKMAEMLNAVYDQNGGRILMALTSAAHHKLLSSTTMSNAVLDFFTSKAVDSKFKITKGQVKNAVIAAANAVIVRGGKDIGLNMSIKKSASLNDILSQVKEKLGPDNSNFPGRKLFSETLIGEMANIIKANEVTNKQFGEIFSVGIQNKYFKGITKTGKIKISKANMIQAMSEMLTEPILKEGVDRNSGGQVYAVIELNGRVESVDFDGHESYPKAVKAVGNAKPILHILKDRLNWNEVFQDSETENIVSKEREMQIFPPTAGISMAGLKLDVRDQVSEVASVVRTAKKNGISDATILKYLKDNGYDVKEGLKVIEDINQRQMKSDQRLEGLFNPDAPVVTRFLDRIHKKYMSGRGFKARSMQALSDFREGLIEEQINIARRNVKRIENAVKNRKDAKQVIESIDRFMRGEKDHGVPTLMLGMVSDMRQHLDTLSKLLVESGAVKSEESAQNIINNLGSYLNRSYEVYDNKNYAKKVSEEVKQAAKNKLREIHRIYAEEESLRTGVPVDIILERRVDRAIDEILNQDEANEFIMRSKLGSKNLTPLEQRKEIPAEIRALMGEYGDPAMNYVRSIQKVASIIANQKFQKELREAGEGVYLFKEPKGEYRVKIAGDGSESMDILAGMYTTKEIAEAMTNGNVVNIDLGAFQPIYDFYLKAVGAVKYTKTILSLGTHAKNVIGNIPFMIMTGNLDFKALNNAVQVLRAEYSKNGKKELLAKMDEYTRLGIINQSATLNEIKDLLAKGETFEDLMLNRFADKGYSRVKRRVKGFFRFSQKSYQVEDDFFKIAAYESEKSKYAKAVFKKDVSELNEAQLKEVSERAAEVVKNVLPNYSRVGGYVKLLKALPVAGTFISFTSESVRTSYNTVDLTIKEIADPKTRAIGIKRLSGIMQLAALKAGLLALWGMDSEDDEDESMKKARKLLPFWDTNSSIAPTKIGDGEFRYRSISASDPHGYITKVFNAYMNADNYDEGLVNALVEAYQPWLNPDMTFSVVSELLSNRDSKGRSIFKEGDTVEEKAIKITERLWKIAEPGTVTSVRKIFASDNPVNEIVGQFTGFKEQKVDIIETIGYKSSDIQRRVVEINDYSKAKKEYDKGGITIEELREEYDKANAKKKKVYEEAIEIYQGAIFFGADPKEVQQRMMDWGIPKYIMKGLIYGEVPDINP